ncbi:carboxymuconolactone decarboxylase family protein [Mycobacteroides immunogenum]|uniref:carboxymuconolactone decarboxylase family protein n=1 Tax=Mycobacteroides immunogenum TaxID=83262 RepID=UPI0025B768CA|nr:carboxymuconolactone decarboxylase family protein [Mycobacteroides immunogenum]WJR33187.1 carboxymuconolactone decarboxylase family protein [Mycobacteroides immunogenum]
MSSGRIPSGGLRELGPINWVIAKGMARAVNAPEMHLATTLGQTGPGFWPWLAYSGAILRGTKLSTRDTEVVILRVAHVRECEYELQHHTRIAKSAGIEPAHQERIFAGANAEGLSDKERALITGVDEILTTRTLSDEAWEGLSKFLDRRQLIGFCLLTTQYDGLAATMSSLRIPLDH